MEEASENPPRPHDLSKYFTPPSIKGRGFNSADQAFRVKEFNKYVIQVATKDGLPTSIQVDLEDKHEDYFPIYHEE